MALPVIFAALAKAGLSLLGNAVLAKGKEAIEQKLGVKIPDDPRELTPEKSAELLTAQFAHEEFLVTAALKEKELDIEADKAGQAQVTDRWKSDMASDSWLSKNVRPMTLVYWTAAISIMAFASEWLKVDALWIDVIKWSYVTILSAYFVGRGAEKATSMITKMKEKTSVSRR